ncbi:hypothetical protein BU24DRAFT_461652 [Aaosphaeria arxii CBS 175.79]|uniref:Uncharacterized protein n=1 Tax=Aaosphaeria arxii CBS 175.79 TaxID=1450172 RepID=A0A6A5XQ54_9PLEO|nr:uncharacterized protein BU24DRAFT_461652 [Aaosphaeria arxii CBS 175.79]KAF2015405.1 hypothetical protein BU24DRAFT_461652 [Aaosphaeria arxii CBS 175.79]
MKILTILSPAILAATAFAAEESSSSSSSTESSSSSTSTSSKLPDPTPVGEIWNAKWKAADLSSYTKKCASSIELKGEIYKLGELYPTLKTWAPQLKVFYNKQLYPGSWNGVDKHGNDRELLKLDYEALPFAVREWLASHPKQKHFSVQEDIVFFAPGAIYPILPLFVDEPDSDVGECEGVFDDLDNYSASLKDDAVLGTVEHKKGKGKHDVEIKISAFQAVKKVTGRDEL